MKKLLPLTALLLGNAPLPDHDWRPVVIVGGHDTLMLIDANSINGDRALVLTVYADAKKPTMDIDAHFDCAAPRMEMIAVHGYDAAGQVGDAVPVEANKWSDYEADGAFGRIADVVCKRTMPPAGIVSAGVPIAELRAYLAAE